LKQALLGAKSIAYTTTGASGIYFNALIERLGIAPQVRAKARTPAGGSVSEMVAKGEADMAVQQIPEILAVKGVQFAGPLPREIQNFTTYPAAVFVDAKQPAAAASLVKFLSTPAAARVIQAKGMESAGPQ
jgi:molybdate transport system substrate-binding protein